MAVWLTAGFVLNSQNVANNTSNVTAWVDANTNYGSYNLNDPAPYGEITFWGNSASSGAIGFNHTFNANTNTRIYTRTYTVTHNADGTAAISLSVWLDTQVSSGRVYGEASLTLPTIARASTPTVTGTKQLGSTMTIATNRASSSFTHTLKWSWAGRSGTIASNVGASTTWTPSIATFAPYLTNGTTSTCTITCDTYNGSTLIGTKTTSFALGIPSSVVPNISGVTFSDAKGYSSTYGGYVVGKSNLQMTINAVGSYGSNITKYFGRLSGGSTKSGTSKTLTLGAPTSAGQNAYTATVTDSRGRQDTLTGSVSALAYSPPNLTGTTAERYNTSTGKSDDESTTIRVTLKGSTTNLGNNGTNVASLKIEYKVSTATSWTTIWSSANAGTSFNTGYNISNCPVTNSYDIRVTVTDKIGESAVKTFQVGTAQPVMDFLAGGKGMAIGKVATKQNLLDVGWDLDAQNISGYSLTSSFRKSRVHGHGVAGSSNEYILIAQNSLDVEGAAESGDIEIYGTIGAYQASNRAFIHIAIPLRDIKTAGAEGIHVIDRSYNYSGSTTSNIQVYIDSSGILRVYVVRMATKWYYYNLYVDCDDTGISVPLTQSSSPIGTLFFDLANPPRKAYTVTTDMRKDIFARNNVYFGATTTSGTQCQLFGINSSDNTILQWTSGGLQGHVRRQLWTGTWNVGGTITVPNGMFYNMFLIFLANAVNDRLIATRQNRGGTASSIVGVGGVVSGTIWVNAVRITTNNNSWTLQGCRTGAINNPGGESNVAVTRIDGII